MTRLENPTRRAEAKVLLELAGRVTGCLPQMRCPASATISPLGKHKIARSCRYIDKLADIDLNVLAKIVTDAAARMRRDYESFDR